MEVAMSKGLEALKRIKREKPTFFSAIYDGDMWEEDAKTIEKELKALKLIKDKQVDIFYLMICLEDNIHPLRFYNEEMDERNGETLTQEEFYLLKEELE